ncbi:hypothetical protein NDU88_002313 [Pleurodeles waltl]|uniref:Uncharacterized protein n=1 Tax=Pleurodeles waltl TaxID=8319 RepID=A0AAV7KYK7_PLEWA|nr:hypothetical protein NDU88_002313 [Pleurodeles waltl]
MSSLRSQERLVLFICDPGKIHCHSDLLIFQQEWTLRPCLQKDLPGLLVTEKTRDDRAGSPRGYGMRRADPVYLWNSSGGEKVCPVSSGSKL